MRVRAKCVTFKIELLKEGSRTLMAGISSWDQYVVLWRKANRSRKHSGPSLASLACCILIYGPCSCNGCSLQSSFQLNYTAHALSILHYVLHILSSLLFPSSSSTDLFLHQQYLILCSNVGVCSQLSRFKFLFSLCCETCNDSEGRRLYCNIVVQAARGLSLRIIEIMISQHHFQYR